MLDRLDETIVAISSPPGWSAVGIVRASGPAAIRIADRLARLEEGRELGSLPGFSRAPGLVFLDDRRPIPADFYVFRAPRSYTRQDLVEIHTIGSPVLLEVLRRRLIAGGAVPALPGEFTARAFLHGGMDLIDAEAVAGIVRAQDDVQLAAAHRMKDGFLGTRIAAARDELANLLALVEAEIDFTDEPVDFISPQDAASRLAQSQGRLEKLIASAVLVERFSHLPRVILLGKPNAGKSTIVNRLSGMARALCSDVPGTTRDVLTAPVPLRRGLALVCDTAGLDEKGDEIIVRGQAHARTEATRADLVCLVVDAKDPSPLEVLMPVKATGRPRIIVVNKIDLVAEHDARHLARILEEQSGAPVTCISALTGENVEQLRDTLATALAQQADSIDREAVIMSERQHAALACALGAVQRAIDLTAQAGTKLNEADLLAFELRDALDTLGGVTGAVTTDDLLGRVFAEFCIGK